MSFASNLLLNLSQQLLATELNILRGVQPPAQVSQVVTGANAGIQITIDGQGQIQLTTALTQAQMSALVTTLTAFNEGKLKGPATPSSADLQIVESIPANVEVSSITCDPSARCSTIDLDAGRATATVVGGTTTTVTYTNRSSQPEPPPPPPSGDSSQELIERDLRDGVIDYPTSLVYRAWALFWDARLPARYDGIGSTGEDQSLFSEIEAALPSLPPDQQAETPGLDRAPDRSPKPLRTRGCPGQGGDDRGRGGGDVRQVHRPQVVVPRGRPRRRLRKGVQGLDVRSQPGRRQTNPNAGPDQPRRHRVALHQAQSGWDGPTHPRHASRPQRRQREDRRVPPGHEPVP